VSVRIIGARRGCYGEKSENSLVRKKKKFHSQIVSCMGTDGSRRMSGAAMIITRYRKKSDVGGGEGLGVGR